MSKSRSSTDDRRQRRARQQRVSDSGVGMTAEMIEQVFEPFFTTKPERQGPAGAVIFATGEAARPDDGGAEALSASVLLRKPYDASALLDAIAAAVGEA